MHFLFLIAIVTLVSCAPAAFIDGLTTSTLNVVGLDFKIHVKAANESLVKRGEYPTPLKNVAYYYITYMKLGSNNQTIGVNIDTGSSDLWVPDVSLSGKRVAQWSTYNPSQSTTSHDLGKQINISYVDHTHTSGNFYTDSVSFDGIVLHNFQFADATSAIGGSGILGIGPISNEAMNQSLYPNFPVALKNAGYIDKVGYSLYLGDVGSNEGSFLFGGKDLAKIDGDAVNLKHTGNMAELSVTLESIAVDGLDHPSGSPYTLDSGTTSAYFEPSLYATVLKTLGFTGKHDPYGNAIVNCSQEGDIEFKFDGITIPVPKSEFVISEGTGAECVTTIRSDPKYHILGNLFLRRVYLLYDLEDLSVQMSKVKYTTATNIVPL